jgi:hypothetical protein
MSKFYDFCEALRAGHYDDNLETMKSHQVSEHPRTSDIQKRGKIMRLVDLPQTSQDALIHYMSVDGAAWAVDSNWPDWKWGEGQPLTLKGRAEVLADIDKFRQRFLDEFGEQCFGYVEVPWQELQASMEGDDDYTSNDNAGPKISSDEYEVPTWPVILSESPDETLQDGWNRFSVYRSLNMTVPVVWYIDQVLNWNDEAHIERAEAMGS